MTAIEAAKRTEEAARQDERLLLTIAFAITGSRQDAEDVVYKKLFDYYQESLDGAPIRNAKAWLVQAVRRAAISVCRRKKGKAAREVTQDAAGEIEDRRQPEPEEALVKEELLSAAFKAMSALPTAQARIVAMRLLENRKLHEIAGEMKMKLSTVHLNFHTAIDTLRRAVNAE